MQRQGKDPAASVEAQMKQLDEILNIERN